MKNSYKCLVEVLILGFKKGNVFKCFFFFWGGGHFILGVIFVLFWVQFGLVFIFCTERLSTKAKLNIDL